MTGKNRNVSSRSTQGSRISEGTHDRKLRYRNLLEDLANLECEDVNNERHMNKTSDVLKEARDLLTEAGVDEWVKHPGEGYLNSRVLRATSDLSLRWAQSASGNINSYDKHELALHIKQNPEFWVFSFRKEVPSCLSLLGTFAPTPPEQRARAVRRVERQRATALTAPAALDKLDKEEEGSETVNRVHRFITKSYMSGGRRPLSYFHLVLDPTSFASTVENIYNISFLVRDGLVAIHLDEDSELPFVTPVSSGLQENDISEENQFIVSIDMPRWKELIDAFKITKPGMVLKAR